MPEIKALSKNYELRAFPRSKTIEYAAKVTGLGQLLQEDGYALEAENGDLLWMEGTLDLRLSYALQAEPHMRELHAFRRFDLAPAWETVEGYFLLEFSWDNDAYFEGGDTSEFDSETDADGDLNAAAAAAYDGSYGIEITFDDLNEATGRLNAAAIDQTNGVISFYLDLNDWSQGASGGTNIVGAEDGAGTMTVAIQVSFDNKIAIFLYDDSPAWIASNWYQLTAGYHHIRAEFRMSTAAGSNNGEAYLYVDGVLRCTLTGVDNDTMDWDWMEFGMHTSTAASQSGSYYMDTIKVGDWSDAELTQEDTGSLVYTDIRGN